MVRGSSADDAGAVELPFGRRDSTTGHAEAIAPPHRARTISPLPSAPVIHDRWNDRDAQAAIDRYGAVWGEALALRVYSSRLIGGDRALVLHGGGNTSVKTTRPDPATGEALAVICVKGSGSDLATVEPSDHPALRLPSLTRLSALTVLDDDAMVNQLRIALLDANAPTPSIETLLHAFVAPTWVDHTHADAVALLGNLDDGESRLRDALGEDIPILPWIMPGFPLALAVRDVLAKRPDCTAIVLRHHGVFTFGSTARASYARMIDVCGRAEQFLHARAERRVVAVAPPAPSIDATAALLALRAALGGGGVEGARTIAELRADAHTLALASHPAAGDWCRDGLLTPDHVIRTKGEYLHVPLEHATDRDAVAAIVRAFEVAQSERFDRLARGRALSRLDTRPKVAVIGGVGVVGIGHDKRSASIVADLAVATLRGKSLASACGPHRTIADAELFEMEYWALEQRKLRGAKPSPLQGQIAWITGAGGAIGHGIAEELLAAGAHVVLVDRDGERLATATADLRRRHPGDRLAEVVMDVTDESAVAAGLRECVAVFGGLDVVVANAGVAHVATLETMQVSDFRRVFDVNVVGTMLVLRESARVFRAQGRGGSVVLQGSKNVTAPGAGFGAYSASKAAATQLARIAALELAPLGVRVNTIHADAVFGDTIESGLWAEVGPARMRARGLDAAGLREHYRERSLLRASVRPADVGRAVVFFCADATRTTGAFLPVDAGLPEAFPR